MPAKRHRVFIYVGSLLALNWISLAFLDFNYPLLEFVTIGYFFGSLFAQTTLAGAWTAFGPARLIWRLPLSFVWVMLLPVAIGIKLLNGRVYEEIILLGSCLLGQWLLIQFPLWVLALVLRLRLRHIDKVKQESDAVRVRFGIRHLLIVMAIASVLLGIGRIVVPKFFPLGDELVIVFLAVAAIILTLPLLLAALMRRMAIPGVLLALVLTAVATGLELPLLTLVGGDGPQTGHFIAINVASALLILLVAGALRMNGYFLCAQPAAASTD